MRRLRVAIALLTLVNAATVLSAQQAPRAAQASLRVGISSGGASGAETARGIADTARDHVARPRTFVSQVVLGAVGSAGGAIAGIYAGRAVCEATSPCIGEDPGLTEGFTGAIVGSIVGTALGTHLGARLAGGRGGHWGARLGGALLGLLAGGLAFEAFGGDADRALALAAFPITQALVTTLLSPRE